MHPSSTKVYKCPWRFLYSDDVAFQVLSFLISLFLFFSSEQQWNLNGRSRFKLQYFVRHCFDDYAVWQECVETCLTKCINTCYITTTFIFIYDVPYTQVVHDRLILHLINQGGKNINLNDEISLLKFKWQSMYTQTFHRYKFKIFRTPRIVFKEQSVTCHVFGHF